MKWAGWLAMLTLVASVQALAEDDRVSAGRDLAHSYDKGNCLGCHKIPADAKARTLATLGPVLSGMRERYPDRELLRSRLWDATAYNPNTIMPPFGKHDVLTDQEIELIIDYLYQY
ncbi:MAG: sulfur oxidation c-type cytochrome SoxX [Betaproteobacteria bacterium]|nr:sulfur oxidation c-type cytochrome SoxX [Betaproteobacteria bacterium]